MEPIKNIALIGLGAVGAVVASQLNTLKNVNFYCVADSERKKRYEHNGIFINNERQSFYLVTPDELKPADLVIIATKNLQIDEALKQIKNAVTDKTMILSLLNGIQSEREIEKAYGVEKTLYGFIISITSINLNGNISCTSNGTIVFGEKDNTRSPRICAVEQLFNRAGISCQIPENIQLEMWKKFLINVVFNSLGAITRSPYGGFKFEAMKNSVMKIGQETIKVANAEGIPLTEDLLQKDIDLTLSYIPTGKCSMLQDVEAGRLTENDFFTGTIIKLGEKHGIPTPYCRFLYDLIKGTEQVHSEFCK